MKTIAEIALVSEVTPGAIAPSGVSIGLVLLVLGASGPIDRLARLVPQSILSGLQLGLGMALGWIALGLMTDHVGVGIISLGVAVAALRFGAHAAIVTILCGLALDAVLGLSGDSTLVAPATAQWPAAWPTLAEFRTAVTALALPQLALTLTNAVFLAALVAGDRYDPRAAHVTPRRLCQTSGAANLLLAPFGALPMCHGAGGVAAPRTLL